MDHPTTYLCKAHFLNNCLYIFNTFEEIFVNKYLITSTKQQLQYYLRSDECLRNPQNNSKFNASKSGNANINIDIIITLVKCQRQNDYKEYI